MISTEAVVHVRYGGISRDLPFGDLDLGPESSDKEVKRAVAGLLNINEAQLADYVVDRHETGNITVRPQAVFG